ALNLLLHQVHLTYVVGDEVLKVTTEDQARGRMETRVHSVLDLVMPVADANTSSNDFVHAAMTQMTTENPNLKLNAATPYVSPNSIGGLSTPLSQSQSAMTTAAPSSSRTPTVTKENPKATMQEELMRLIMNTIAPLTWRDVGGQGTIEFYPLGMAL